MTQSAINEKIFSSLHLSKERLLNEMAILLAKQQLSEYEMEIEYYENKYEMGFNDFQTAFQNDKSSYEAENDWMSWKFAIDSRLYWKDILSQASL